MRPRESEIKTRDEVREIRSEVTNIHEMLPKVRLVEHYALCADSLVIQMIEKNKEAQSQSLGELQQELKSLKALLLSRGPPTPSTPTIPSFSGYSKPSIPAWKLAPGDHLLCPYFARCLLSVSVPGGRGISITSVNW